MSGCAGQLELGTARRYSTQLDIGDSAQITDNFVGADFALTQQLTVGIIGLVVHQHRVVITDVEVKAGTGYCVCIVNDKGLTT